MNNSKSISVIVVIALLVIGIVQGKWDWAVMGFIAYGLYLGVSGGSKSKTKTKAPTWHSFDARRIEKPLLVCAILFALYGCGLLHLEAFADSSGAVICILFLDMLIMIYGFSIWLFLTHGTRKKKRPGRS